MQQINRNLWLEFRKPISPNSLDKAIDDYEVQMFLPSILAIVSSFIYDNNLQCTALFICYWFIFPNICRKRGTATRSDYGNSSCSLSIIGVYANSLLNFLSEPFKALQLLFSFRQHLIRRHASLLQQILLHNYVFVLYFGWKE